MTTTHEDTAIRRIKGLLAKAEGTANPHEAEAFFAKAAELMEKYRIDEAHVRGNAHGEIASYVYVLKGTPFLRASLGMLVGVAKHYGVVVLTPSTGNSKQPRLVGEQADIDATILMFESLMLQRGRALASEQRPGYIHPQKFGNSFSYGYATRITERLREIREAARVEAVSDSMALEVFDRHRKTLEHLGNPRARTTNRTSLDRGAATSGVAAADRADLGQRRMGAGPIAIGQ
jgi:hypothetical protein